MHQGSRTNIPGHSEARCAERRHKAAARRPAIEALEYRMLLAGDGLAAIYYDAQNFTGTSVARIDPQVNFDWGLGSPDAKIHPNKFSARWTGQIDVPTSGTYRFYVRADDGARLWVNGQLVVDAWRTGAGAERSGQITLQAGQRYDLKMDYYEHTGIALAQLRWSGPGISKQIVPQADLYSTTLPSAPTQLTASASPGAVALNWLDNATNETGYSILRSTDQVNFSEIARAGAGATSYTDSTVAAGTTYYYRVLAYNAAGSSAPATTSITTIANLTLNATAAANVPKVLLQWNDPLANETGYVVERSSDGASFQTVATLPANTTSYTDTAGLAGGAKYWYRVSSTGSVAVTATPVTVNTADFHLCDTLLYSGKPDLTPNGIENAYIGYESSFMAQPRSTDPAVRATVGPDEARTREVARQAVAAGDKIVIIDIECWPVDIRKATPAQVQQSMQWFTQVIGWLRSEAPGLKVGIYGVLPLRDCARPDLFTADQMQGWSQANAFLAPLAAQVDYVFPSLYTFSQDPTMWQGYAQANIDQAKQYGKPIMPFIWNEYHPGNTTIPAGTSLPADYWRLQLDTLRKTANGAVMWGGYNETWDSSAPWWQQTLGFTSM